MLGFVAVVFACTYALQLGAIFFLPAESLPQAALLGLGGIAPGVIALFWAGRRLFRGSGGRPLLAAIGAVLIPIAGATVSGAVDGHLILTPPTPDPTTIFLLLFAPFFEELAWRGLLQRRWDDALRARTGRPASFTVPRVSLVVGLLWGLWHLPMGLAGGALSFAIFVAHAAVVSVWMGALFELGGRRVWVAMLAHAAINLRLVESGSSWTARIAGFAVTLGFAVATSLLLRQRRE